jgi:hypothetical protein
MKWEGWKRLQNELHNLHSSSYIIRTMESTRMVWAVHEERMGTMSIQFWLESLEAEDHSENLGVDGRIISK